MLALVSNGSGRVRTETAVIVPRATPGERWRAFRADPRWTLYAGLAILNVFDLITTSMVLDRGGAERNPFVQPIVHDLRLVALLKMLILVLVGTLLTRCRGSRIAELSLAGTAGWYFAVVCWNVAVLTML